VPEVDGEELLEGRHVGRLFHQRRLERVLERLAVEHADGSDGLQRVGGLGQRDAHAAGAERGDELDNTLIHTWV
jgi:hypothetical protein